MKSIHLSVMTCRDCPFREMEKGHFRCTNVSVPDEGGDPCFPRGICSYGMMEFQEEVPGWCPLDDVEPIEVTVQGGVAEVCNVPPGITVRVKDYDVDEPSGEDEYGPYIESIYGGDDEADEANAQNEAFRQGQSK